MLGVIYSTDTS